jgi:hypothetical protein
MDATERERERGLRDFPTWQNFRFPFLCLRERERERERERIDVEAQSWGTGGGLRSLQLVQIAMLTTKVITTKVIKF